MSEKIKYDKTIYAEAVGGRLDVPVFFKPWWLTAICKKKWEVLSYVESGKVLAAYTYFPRKKWGFKYVTMPTLTRFMGPIFLEDFGIRKKQKITNEMLQALPDYDGVEQTLDYQVKDWLPFSWAGYSQTSKYSFVLPDIRDIEKIHAGLSPKYRNNKIPRAQAHLSLKPSTDIDQAWEFFKAPFRRQGTKIPVREKAFRRIALEVIDRKSGGIFLVEDEAGKAWANAFVAWQGSKAYLLMLGEHPDGRSSYAGIGLIWFLIEYLSEEIGIIEFDFLGSMSRRIARVRQDFGAESRTYFLVAKEKAVYSMMKRLKR